MFALCSDVDHAVSLDAYVEFMRFLNTEKETCYGPGLNLELSNSFWFYNAEADDQLSYFEGTSSRETAFAPVCRSLWESGHLDALHTYGNFNEGGFHRGLAERALDELSKHGVNIPVWINHGNDFNTQKIGNYSGCEGADPNSPSYHLDLLSEAGTRFFWAGRTTHVAGQAAEFSLGNQFQQKLQKLVLKTKYRKIQRPLPDAPNRLLIQTEMADGRQVLEFQRFISRLGEVKNTDLPDLGLQLSEGNLNALVKSGGFMLLYTHMNENLPEKAALPVPVTQGFLRLKHLNDEQVLLVTTASRLLVYADLIQHLEWEVKEHHGGFEIHLSRDDHRTIEAKDLIGLCFYTDHPEQTSLSINGKLVAVQVNAKDLSGRTSISVPWPALDFPL
jgi:hypothetical protein